MKVRFKCTWSLRIGRLRLWWDTDCDMLWTKHDFAGRVRLWAFGPLVVTWLNNTRDRA